MRGLTTSGSYRLYKPRTNESTSSKSPVSPIFPVHQVLIQTSYEDLRRPQARQLLREQLSGTFPEADRSQSEDSARGSIMVPLKERFMRRSSGQDIALNASAQSSSSTVDSLGPKRLSAVTEKGTKALDVEQAINLLQELKKTASPDELVALHRALLPTKDVDTVTSPRTSAADERTLFANSAAYQRRSAIPPGLATRGGFAEDLLRKPGEGTAEPSKASSKRPVVRLQHSISVNGAAMHAHSISNSSLAALDLADDGANPIGSRAITPLEYPFPQAGGYRPGTLHITNGAASPEPSLRTAGKLDKSAMTEPKEDDGYFASSEERPSLEITRGRASVDVLPGRTSMDSLRIRDRILGSDKAQQQRKQRAQRLSNLSTPSRESIVSLQTGPLQVGTKLSQQSLNRRSVSPLSISSGKPRFQQRWSHRASQISAEYVSDCDVPASPYDEKNALLNFATRLSTVFDSDGDDGEDEEGTPAVALSRLTGDTETMMASSPNTTDDTSTSPAEEPSEMRTTQIKRPLPKKGDSGYASEMSFCNTPQRPSFDKRKASSNSVKRTFIATDAGLNEVQEAEESTDPDETQSLYTFAQILESPTPLSGTPASPQTAKAKKSLAPLRLRTLRAKKHSSLPTDPAASTESIATVKSAQTAPANVVKPCHISKQQKKLQKPVPASVRKKQKEEMRKLRAAQTPPELPALTDSGPSFSHIANTEDMDLPEVATPTAETHPDYATPTNAVDADIGSASRERSKSRGRGRSSSIRHISELEAPPEVQRGWSIAKLRNKSRSRTRSQTPKRSSFDVVMRQAMPKQGHEMEASSPGDETMPAWTDFSSVARSLGSGSYDISTNQFKRATAPAPGATLHELQSPYLYSTGLSKAKHVKGMNSEAASELARMKSRDVTRPDMDPNNERPKTAISTRSGKQRNTSGPIRRVEDRFPEWQSKPASREASPQRPQMTHRPHSIYAESIPPLPEMPADAEVKASRADQMVAKKLKDSTRSSPNASARSSQDAQPRSHPGLESHVTSVQVSTAVKLHEQASLELLHPSERAAAKQAAIVDIQVRELAGSGSEQSSFVETPDEEPLQSPNHDSRHSGWPGWEQQANAWRQKRESLGKSLGQTGDEISVITADSPPVSRKSSYATLLQREPSKSPSIVVSRYITPLAAETNARAIAGTRVTDAALRRANVYRDLIGDDRENRPTKQDVPRTDSAVTTSTTSTFVTVKSWDPRHAAQREIPRTDTGNSFASVTTTTTVKSQPSSPGWHARTPSGKYIPYSPAQAGAAEQSRAQSLAKLNGEASASTRSLELASRPKPTHRSTDSLVDRYSGGLEYGWQRGAGFGGSAGTRHDSSEARRKSMKTSVDWGIDLSDVPVMLQRMS